ncbi:MAG: hypothetical protein Alpg2KO_17850 [Alphaproteobacteria bacterium]
MGNRLRKFFGKEIKDAYQGGKDMAKNRPVTAAILGGLTVVGTAVNPAFPVGIAGMFASNKALMDDHKRLVAEIKEAHANGENLDRFKTDLSSFKPDRVKDYYGRGNDDQKTNRQGRNIMAGVGTAIEVATVGGVSLVFNGLDFYFTARDRNKLIERLKSEPPKADADKPSTPPAP